MGYSLLCYIIFQINSGHGLCLLGKLNDLMIYKVHFRILYGTYGQFRNLRIEGVICFAAL